MEIGLHAPLSGATAAFVAMAARLDARTVLWMEAHEGRNARALPAARHIYRVPNPQPGEDADAWAGRVAERVDDFAGAGIPPGALIFQIGNEPDIAGYDLPVPWGVSGWVNHHLDYLSAFKRRWPGFGTLCAPFTCANTGQLTREYVAPYAGIAAHCYWAKDNPGWRQGLDGGAAWRHGVAFGKPVYVTEVNSNPTSGAEMAAWERECSDPLVVGAAWFVADSAANFPEYDVQMSDVDGYLAARPAPPPPVPPPPKEPVMSLWDAICAVTDQPRVRAAMLMGAALETGTITAPWPDQYGGGPGRGPWQIEAGEGGSHYGRISEDDARNPVTAARYMVAEYTRAAADIGDGDYAADPAGALAEAAYRAERPAQRYPAERIVRAYALIAPLIGGVTPTQQRYQIVAPVDCPVAQGSDGGYSHGGASAGFFAVDYACAEGTPVRAAADGTVGVTYWTDSNPISLRTGHSIWIDHDNGYATFSCHLSRFDVATGDRVAQGQVIGLTGTPGNGNGFGDGAHIHWEIWRGGARVRMEDLEAAGLAGPWGGTPIVTGETDMLIEGHLDDGMIERLWYGNASAAARKRLGYNPQSGIGMRWKKELLAGRPLGAAQSGEEADPNRTVQYFTSGAITFIKATGETFVN